jgi:superfamily II DNA helicase RecQ
MSPRHSKCASFACRQSRPLTTAQNYSQEIGRAGRDGLPSECLTFLCAADLPLLESFARGNTPSRLSTRAWLGAVCKAKPAEDGCIDFSSLEQSKTCAGAQWFVSTS